MPKMKTHKGLLKRFRVTAKKKLKHKHPNAGHLMSGKSGRRVRKLRKAGVVKQGPMLRYMRELVGAR